MACYKNPIVYPSGLLREDTAREAIRQWNEQMKQAIKNAQSLEELNSIVIQFSG